MSGDGEMVDLVVRGLTREEVLEIAERPLDPDGFLAALGAAIRSAREMKAEWEREERDATSYTDEQGRRLWLEQGEGGVAIATPDGDPLVPHPALLAVVNAARERDGLPRLVEEPASDPLRLDIGAAEFAAAVGATDVHAALAEVRALGERATKLGPAERADEDRP
jgi:hypothetical protein